MAALEAVHSIIGGFTDSKAGSYSIGRAIRNRVQPGHKKQKENNPLDSKEPKTSNFGDKYEQDELIEEDNNEIENKEANKNFDIINDKLKDVKVNKKDEEDKNAMLKAFEYFENEIKKYSLDNLKTMDIFNREQDSNNVGKKGLLDIFSDKEKISEVEVNFVSDGMCAAHFIIKFDCNGKEQKIELWNLPRRVSIEYYCACNDNLYVLFNITRDKLGLQKDNE